MQDSFKSCRRHQGCWKEENNGGRSNICRGNDNKIRKSCKKKGAFQKQKELKMLKFFLCTLYRVQSTKVPNTVGFGGH